MYRRIIKFITIFIISASWTISYSSFAYSNVELSLKLADNIYLDSSNSLEENLFLYKSDYDLKQYKLS